MPHAQDKKRTQSQLESLREFAEEQLRGKFSPYFGLRHAMITCM